MFEMLEFIERKRDGFPHTTDDLAAFVDAVRDDLVPDYQIAVWLMAAFLREEHLRDPGPDHGVRDRAGQDGGRAGGYPGQRETDSQGRGRRDRREFRRAHHGRAGRGSQGPFRLTPRAVLPPRVPVLAFHGDNS